MRQNFSLWLAVVLALSFFTLAETSEKASAQEVMTNQTVVEMVKKGLSEKEIITRIRAAKNSKFDKAPDAMANLEKAGVSKEIMALILNSNSVSPEPQGSPAGGGGGVGGGGGTRVCQECIRYRVIATGFDVTAGTTEGAILMDGVGDEVFVAGNFAEFSSHNALIGSPGSKRSVNYGDVNGTSSPVRPIVGGVLRHNVARYRIIQAGHVSPSGGLRSGDHYPEAATTPRDPTDADAVVRGRFIPVILWEGDLRPSPNPNAVMVIPTIWENDNNDDLWNVWNTQAGAYLRRFARNSSTFFWSSTTRSPLMMRFDQVLDTVPQTNDFSRPIGIEGEPFNPLAATPDPTTFTPAFMVLTQELAEQAVAHGEYIIEYNDGPRYGPGSYKLRLRVQRVSQ